MAWLQLPSNPINPIVRHNNFVVGSNLPISSIAFYLYAPPMYGRKSICSNANGLASSLHGPPFHSRDESHARNIENLPVMQHSPHDHRSGSVILLARSTSITCSAFSWYLFNSRSQLYPLHQLTVRWKVPAIGCITACLFLISNCASGEEPISL